MEQLSAQAAGCGPQRRSLRLGVLGAVLAGTATLGGLLLSVAPAFADVTSNHYTIGSPSGAVVNVSASPATVSRGAETSFELVFYVGAAFSGAEGGAISVTPSEALSSAPADVAVVSGSCIQAGTAGAAGPGSSTPTSLVVDLAASCNVAARAKVEVDFSAAAPPGTGSFSFSVTTTANTSPGTSNVVTVVPSQVILSAALQGFGANTTYSIADVPVENLSSGSNTLVLKAAATEGTETLSFLGAPAGYSVTYTGPSGTAADQVTAVSASGPVATLSLADALQNGDRLNITATGTNPPPSGTVQADDITVQPGNGTAQVTNSIVFGGSVRGVSVSPQNTVAGATTLYTVDFQASNAVAAGGNIILSEKAGPTNFTTVTGALVIDSTANWHFVATRAALANGTAVIPLADSIRANDSVSVVLANVTNPRAGIVRDFTVSTSGDPVPADAAPYTIGPSASPGVVVTVEPTTAGAVATYTISNLRAEGVLQGGSSTIGLQAPAGTVFPNNPGYYHIVDSTTSSGSGTVSAGLAGGGTNDVTFSVPNTVNSGDVLSLTVEDVINPGVPSSTYSITLVGAVTGPAPVPVTTTTVPPLSTTTTVVHHKPKPPAKPKRPKPHPVPLVVLASPHIKVSKGAIVLALRCSRARCRGSIVLKDVITPLGHRNYNLAATGRPARLGIKLDRAAMRLLAHAKHHTITARTAIVVVSGRTLHTKVTLTL